MAYQNVYDITPLSKAQPKLAFLPVTVDCGSVKLTLLESDLEAIRACLCSHSRESMD